eukprot:TRINITY_DN16587_c0_g1_i1.p1 TRINITY_DN16587_c0_g1~~TRINITY_DN16587_c0_g1_i1.p1  ORF type:complete len:245 (+),score=71.67 TRINITY_DN16587_c0_g1_i1:32-736(+)
MAARKPTHLEQIEISSLEQQISTLKKHIKTFADNRTKVLRAQEEKAARSKATQMKADISRKRFEESQKPRDFCKYFIRGSCTNPKCKFIHDPKRVAVCPRFLQGQCTNPSCPLQHVVEDGKMPVCFHFLRGICTNEACPYSHVKVSSSAKVCPDFLSGFCKAGKDCKLKHTFETSSSSFPPSSLSSSSSFSASSSLETSLEEPAKEPSQDLEDRAKSTSDQADGASILPSFLNF